VIYTTGCNKITGYTKKTAGISGTYSLGMKTDMRVLFAVSSTETVFLHTNGKSVRCKTLYNEGQL
jgi:hypothetical protein